MSFKFFPALVVNVRKVHLVNWRKSNLSMTNNEKELDIDRVLTFPTVN